MLGRLVAFQKLIWNSLFSENFMQGRKETLKRSSNPLKSESVFWTCFIIFWILSIITINDGLGGLAFFLLFFMNMAERISNHESFIFQLPVKRSGIILQIYIFQMLVVLAFVLIVLFVITYIIVVDFVFSGIAQLPTNILDKSVVSDFQEILAGAFFFITYQNGMTTSFFIRKPVFRNLFTVTYSLIFCCFMIFAHLYLMKLQKGAASIQDYIMSLPNGWILVGIMLLLTVFTAVSGARASILLNNAQRRPPNRGRDTI